MSDAVPEPARSREWLVGFLIFIAALATSLTFTHAGWNNTVIDTHPFRQSQTELSTYWMIREGFRLDYATPVMGAPWSIPMEFPLYQAAVATVVRATGMPLEPAGRAVSLFFFYASLPAIWLLLRRLAISAPQRWLFLALVLTCPIYIFYSRTFLIESTAFCLGCWFLFSFQTALDRKGWLAVMAAALLGIAAGLTKVTSFAVFLAPATALGLVALARRWEEWRGLLLRGCSAALPGIFAAAAWVSYSDSVKRHNVLGVSLTSDHQRAWNYGPWLLRFEPDFWRQFGVQLERAISPWIAVPVLVTLVILFLRRERRVFAFVVPVALAGPLVFANLYFVHDYYLYSSGVFFLVLMALPLKEFFERNDLSLALRSSVVVLVLLLQFSGYVHTYYQPQITAAPKPPEIVSALREITAPDDVILGFGMNWNSIFPLYSERRAVMVPDEFVRDHATISKALANLGGARVGAVVLFRLGQPAPEYYQPWLKQLAMDENPFMQTGEYTVHLRKDMLPTALKAIGVHPLKDVLLYQGQLAKTGEKPPLIYWTDQLADRSVFSMMTPLPTKVSVPFGLGAEGPPDHRLFTAHTPTEVDIAAPAEARHITIEYGMNPAAYERSDGVEFEIVWVRPNGARQRLFYRNLLPALLAGDRGLQTSTLETATPIDGHLLFRTLPGGSPNYDWAYWAKIEVR